MELNILKQDICVNEKIFSQSSEHPIDSSFILPDYYPEISKILKCRAVPRISATRLNGQTLTVDGTVLINLIYCSSENEIFGYEQTLQFSKTFEIGTEIQDAIPECNVKCEYINCRAMGVRKIDVHGAVGVYVLVYKKQATRAIADIDNPDIIVRRGQIPATSPMGYGEKSLIIEEELEIGSGQPSIRNILKYDIKAINKECKIISGKIVVKGDLNVFVLYCPDNSNTPQVYRNTIPFSSIIDIDGITEECECSCKTCIALADIKPRTSASGETKSFILNVKLNFWASACCNNDLSVITDAYSTHYNADVSLKDITVEKIFKTVNDVFVCKKSIDNISENIKSVVDIWCDSLTTSSAITNNKLSANGTVTVSLLVLNEAGTPEIIERPLDFNYELPIENATGGMYTKCEITANNLGYTMLSSNGLEITAEMCVNANVFAPAKINLVTDVLVDEANVKTKSNNSALIIYYADAGECVWDIARKYNSLPSEICEINSLENEILKAKKTLLIPIK
ncbi:MAG: DUF3794 domain-containing protein [Clostridia bacterium]|nr:DUF3794 domain-containing protein [Clostridia bacterium]